MREAGLRPMIDGFGRRIDYVRISVTDRCDLRCRYCMAERMTFLPRRELLTLEEIAALADLLIARGVRKFRITGGEPLVRRGIGDLVGWLGDRLGHDLDELTLTTNGTQLERFAQTLAEAGMQRLNVSLDTRDSDTFRHLTRGGDLQQVLRGIETAAGAGLKIKINMVALAGINEGEIVAMLRWCAEQGHDLTLIETMPMGEVGEDRTRYFLPLGRVRQQLQRDFRLIPSLHRSGGPSRYDELPDLGIRLGFITPFSRNFCASCNRIRIAATGTVYACLGRDEKIELRDAIRAGGVGAADSLLDRLIAAKPEGHRFDLLAPSPAVERHMSVTGG